MAKTTKSKSTAVKSKPKKK